MEWMVVNPSNIYSTVSSLGEQVDDSYQVSKDCLATLHEIQNKLCLEDRTLRTFRRALGFAQVIQKDLLPLLINVKDDLKVIDATIRVLVNLTIPVECLLPLDMMSKTETGRHTIFDLNKSLLCGKEAFVDIRSTRAIVNHMKRAMEKMAHEFPVFACQTPGEKLSLEECEGINNCLLLLRNILHIPEVRNNQVCSSLQNQILWNLFAHSLDKVLIHLMTCSQKGYWGITMVQLIAIMYKDQHVGTLQKLLNIWFEASISESSEDNESNTSPPEQGSGGESSPILTSDPTSDSSDNGCSQKKERVQGHTTNKVEEENDNGSEHTSSVNSAKVLSSSESNKSSGKSSGESSRKCQPSSSSLRKSNSGKNKKEKPNENETPSATTNISAADSKPGSSHPNPSTQNDLSDAQGNGKKDCPSSSELSDYGYATQVENQESMSTSSNEDENQHSKRPVHQKPHNTQKTRLNAKPSPTITVQDKRELRRKKLVKRSRTSIMNMKALLHHIPSDEDISNLLKEFTVDFLLKGYGCLVQELHLQLLNAKQEIQVDTSHFFWLVTYFLKFATQLELELEHISPVLSFDIVSYLTYEGVNLCEQLELASRYPGSDLKPCLRQIHLVVTAIREFIQSVESYRKFTHLSEEDRAYLLQLQLQLGSTEDLKCLFVLLLRQFNPKFQSKQYLQDLIATNHILLLFLDDVGKLPEFKGTTNILEHIKQFATVEIMHQYGLLLEDFQNNGEFINDCVFTMMHHIGGDIEQVAALFQPIILKTFSKIWETEFEVCDDWSDLIEYVINKYIDSPTQKPLPKELAPLISGVDELVPRFADSTPDEWSNDDVNNLYWYYLKSFKCSDPVGKVLQHYVENGVLNKTRIGIIQKMHSCDIVDQIRYEEFMQMEIMKSERNLENSKFVHTLEDGLYTIPEDDSESDDKLEHKPSVPTVDKIIMLRDRLLKEKKGKLIIWLQKLLIEACYVKLNVDKTPSKNLLTMEPVPHHYTLMNQSIPVVPWNSDQKNSLMYEPFILLLHKLGFHLPADSGKLFVRIPNFWTPDVLFSIAQKLGPINKSMLKFDATLIKTYSAPMDCGPSSVSSIDEVGNQFALQQYPHSTPIIRTIPISSTIPLSEGAGSQFAVQQFTHSVPIIRTIPIPSTIPPVDEVGNQFAVQQYTHSTPIMRAIPNIIPSEEVGNQFAVHHFSYSAPIIRTIPIANTMLPIEEVGNHFGVHQFAHSSSFLRAIPITNNTANWLQIVVQSKVSASVLPQHLPSPTSSFAGQMCPDSDADQPVFEDDESDCSVSENDEVSVSSDLTCMNVSDEDDQLYVVSDATLR